MRRFAACVSMVVLVVAAACATAGKTSPEREPPTATDAEDLTLLYWVHQYGDAVRRMFGASVNALANNMAEQKPPPLLERSEFDAEWHALAPERRACAVCATLAMTCGGNMGTQVVLQGDARQFQASTFVLRNEQQPVTPLPAGGPTCAQLLARECAACAAQGNSRERTSMP